jgi:hypothetical protein
VAGKLAANLIGLGLKPGDRLATPKAKSAWGRRQAGTARVRRTGLRLGSDCRHRRALHSPFIHVVLHFESGCCHPAFGLTPMGQLRDAVAVADDTRIKVSHLQGAWLCRSTAEGLDLPQAVRKRCGQARARSRVSDAVRQDHKVYIVQVQPGQRPSLIRVRTHYFCYSGKAILIPYVRDSLWGVGTMRKNLFWLSDEQWERIEPHLPTDVRGVERADDRRVIQRHCACVEERVPLMRLPARIWSPDHDL